MLNSTDYDFITNTPNSPKKPLFGASGGKTKLLVMLIGALVALMILIVGASLLLGGGGDSSQSARNLAEKHALLLAITEDAIKNSPDSDLTNNARTLNLSLLSSSTQVNDLLTSSTGDKNAVKKISTEQSTALLGQLEQAGRDNQYPQVYQSIIAEQLESYLATISRTHSEVKSSVNKQFLSELYDQISIIAPESHLIKN